jgi:hypothetical protein
MNYENASAHGEPYFASDKEELKRMLIAQFYEDSVLRYGPDSEQALALRKVLDPNNYEGSEQKSVEPALTNGGWTTDRANYLGMNQEMRM